MTSHAIQHTNTAHHHRRKEQSKAREEDELSADILLLAGVATPFHALCAPIFIRPYDRAVAGARVAISVNLLAISVSRAGVCRVLAGSEAAEVLRDDFWK